MKLKTPYPIARPNHYISLLRSFFLSDMLNTRFKKQTTLDLSQKAKKLDAWEKCSGLVHWEDPEESGGVGGGRGDQDGEYM